MSSPQLVVVVVVVGELVNLYVQLQMPMGQVHSVPHLVAVVCFVLGSRVREQGLMFGLQAQLSGLPLTRMLGLTLGPWLSPLHKGVRVRHSSPDTTLAADLLKRLEQPSLAPG
mmetsp:Transcript_17358/g.33409  ORF Transcript_17358/g.33409 Transcript_17358/m.33409 type:complete len:113 (-) Transcript_17358:1359-1697(-)